MLVNRHANNDERREAVEIGEQALDVARQLARSGKPEDLLRLVEAQTDFSWKLSIVGRYSEALTLAAQAEGLSLTLRSSLSGQARWMHALVRAVKWHSTALRNKGQFEEALEKAKLALQLLQGFGHAAADETRVDEAQLYLDLSQAYSKIGDDEAGLDTANQAEAIIRKLMEKDPDSQRNLRALSLYWRGMHLSATGDFEDALQASELAAELYEQLADQQPDLHANDLSNALTQLNIHCRDMNRFDQALKAARRAELIARHLANRQPEAYQFNWVISLANLGEALLSTQEFVEAIEVTEQAVDLLPSLPPEPGFDQQRIAPGFCQRVLAEAWLGNGDLKVALEVAEEGADSLREAFAARPHHVAEHYVQGLVTLAKCHRALGDDPAAIQVLAEGIDGVTPLFKKRPRALQREMLRLIEPLDAIGPAAARHVTDDVRGELKKLPELPRGAAGL